MRRVALAATLCLAGPALAQDAVLPAVREVMERVNTPSVDYSVVRTMRVTGEGQDLEWIGAEYRRGPLQRIEFGPYREIDNCVTGERHVYLPSSDTVQSMSWGGDCYLPGLEPLSSTRILPRITGPWGRADVIEVTGQHIMSRYVVTQDGILISYNNRMRSPEFGRNVRTLRVMVTRGPPDAALFEPASLRHAAAQPLPRSAPRAP